MGRKLTKDKIEQIKEFLKEGYSYKEIAHKVGIAHMTAYYYTQAIENGYDNPIDYRAHLNYERLNKINKIEVPSAIKPQSLNYIFKLKIIEATTSQTLELKVEEFMQSIAGSDSQRNYISGYKKYMAFIEYYENPNTIDETIDKEKINDLSIKKNSIKLEISLIIKALKETNGNLTRASQILEISHRALLYKIKEYNLRPKLESFRKL